jgi:hypothetical protein
VHEAASGSEVHDLVRWANASDLPSTRHIGRHAVGRVLLGLAVHADRNGDAWPSAQTLADQISGLSRWDVRNALDALESHGLIKRNGLRGRSIVWRLAIDMAGFPATSGAGDVAGEVAGTSAGYPAPKRREVKRTRPARAAAGDPGAFGPTRQLKSW